MAKKKIETPGQQGQTDSADDPKPSEPKLDETIRMDTVQMDDDLQATIDVDPNAQTVADSILTSGQIGQTINPRELSDADVTLWNSAVGESNQGTDGGPSEIEDSYAERQFEKLRHVDVAELKSDSDTTFDYRLVRKLGEGGMGDVFVARQGSLDRLLALKLIKPLSDKMRDQLEKTGRLDSVEEERRQQFLSEAIVTGDLDHPNIVPIHDVGLTSDNQLFYAMKRVVGTPWSDVINSRSRDENLEILLKASDAIGFAHTRGVVHRDIKPENIMLGDFGVVMVMDWGLALLTSEYEKQESITATSGLGGTPAFMSPEMASGPVEKIDSASDIYLLGATLFVIITGKPPHYAKNITQCLHAVRVNKIRDVPPEMEGELLDVALKAMETDPEDRYEDVEGFQNAIREYRSHAESISLAARASDDLETGKQTQSYADLSRARFRFEESLKSWDGNEKADRGLAETKIVHAESAYRSGDYDLGLSLLDDQTPEHQPIIEKLRAGTRERDSRATRLSLLRKVAVALLAFIIIGGGVAMYNINKQKQIAQAAHGKEIVERRRAEDATTQALIASKKEANARAEAEIAKEEAETQEGRALFAAEDAKEQARKAKLEEQEAERQRKLAEDAEKVADEKRVEAQKSQAEAVASQKRASYEEYVSKIGLAKARLERNEVDGARKILLELKAASPQAANSWEWRWLWRQANQSRSEQKAGSAVIDLSISGRSGVVALSNGQIKRFTIDDQGKITSIEPVAVDPPLESQATSVAIAAKGNQIAIGARSGLIVLVGDGLQRSLRSHRATVSDLQYSTDGLLVSGSHDKTVRVWDVHNGHELTKNKACWHISPVRQIAVTDTAASLKVAVAVADDSGGRVELWDLRRRANSIVIKPAGTFDQHRQRVTTVAISTDARRVASGDAGGNVFVWNSAEVNSTDYSASLADAIAAIEDSPESSNRKRSQITEIEIERLVDSARLGQSQLVSTPPANNRKSAAHEDVIRSIRFNADGSALLTASDDNTLKLWNVNQTKLQKTLKGHGGWVVGADFIIGSSDIVVSASNDATVRSWNPKTYTGSFVSNRIAETSEPNREIDAHLDELSSASLSPDGTHIVTTSQDHTARVLRIDPKTLAFTEVARLDDELLQEGSEFVAMSMQLDHTHQRLYVGSADAIIRIWDLRRGVEIGQANNTGLNTSFAISADGTLMLTGSSSPDVKAILWQLDPTRVSSPRVLHRVKGHHQAVTAFAISSDSRQFYTGDRDGRGFLWNAKTGEPIGEPVDLLRGSRINAAVFSPDAAELLVGADDEQLTRIHLPTRSIVSRSNHDGVVTQVSLSPNGGRALTVSELSTRTGLSTIATLWDVDSGRRTILDRTDDSDRSSNQRITSARFDSTGKLALVSRAAASGSGAVVRLWELESKAEQRQFVNMRSDRSTNNNLSKLTFRLPSVLGTPQMALPIEDHSILTMNRNGVFRWNTNNKKLVRSYRPHAALTEASFSFDGKRIVTASRSIKIWDPISGKALGKIESPHAGPVRTVRFSPTEIGDTKYVFATGGDDQFVRTWSWNDKTNEIRQLAEFKVDAIVRRIRFAPDGKQLLIVGDQGLAQLQHLEVKDHRVTFKTSGGGDLASCAFSSDGSLVAMAGRDSIVRLWKVPQPGKEPADPVVLSGHADVVNDIKIVGKSVGKIRVLTASADDTARIWDPRLDSETNIGREMLSLRRHTTDVMAIDATENGDLVMTAGRDGSLILWPAGE